MIPLGTKPVPLEWSRNTPIDLLILNGCYGHRRGRPEYRARMPHRMSFPTRHHEENHAIAHCYYLRQNPLSLSWRGLVRMGMRSYEFYVERGIIKE